MFGWIDLLLDGIYYIFRWLDRLYKYGWLDGQKGGREEELKGKGGTDGRRERWKGRKEGKKEGGVWGKELRGKGKNRCLDEWKSILGRISRNIDFDRIL